MEEAHTKAQQFLNSIFDSAGLALHAHVEGAPSQSVLNIEGADTSLLLNEGGELLEALQHILNQALYKTLPAGEHFICDVENFRATREAELRAMARHAAERVRSSGIAFTFGVMNANERRVIHVALAGEADLYTESVGDVSARRLRVNRKAT